MTSVIANMTMSIDGFIADPDDGVGDLFGWYDAGPVAFEIHSGHVFHVSEASAALLKEAYGQVGAFMVGRRLYDHTNGWNARPPVEAPMIVVTHDPPDDWPRDGVPITFVSEGIERAVEEAKAQAGGKNVAVAAGTLAREVLAAGLLDEIVIDLAPVVIGEGIPLFAGTANAPHRFSDPEIVQGTGVTHLRFRKIE